jgi:hypothetical protein
MQDHSATINAWVGNILSAGAIGATLIGLLPAVAAGVALVWYTIQIAESKTVQDWIRGRRLRRLAQLKARALLLEAQLRTPIETNKLED